MVGPQDAAQICLERWMDPLLFWQGRRTLVLGCTGFLGTHVVRALLERGAQVTGLIRDSQRPSEFFADRFHRKIRVVRGTADPQRLRSLIAVHDPAAVFQLVSVSGQSHAKHRITSEFLRTVARYSPDLPVVVPITAEETNTIHFRNHPLGQMRVGFVQLPSLFGAGNTSGHAWTSRLFANAAHGHSLPPPERDEPLILASDAAQSLLTAAETLTSLGEPPVEGLWLEAPATTTTRELYHRLAAPQSYPHDDLARSIETTLRWYERYSPMNSQPPIRAAA